MAKALGKNYNLRLSIINVYKRCFIHVTGTMFVSRYSTMAKPKTAIIMMNMGGPSSIDQVNGYLTRIMTDRDMIQLPFMQR